MPPIPTSRRVLLILIAIYLLLPATIPPLLSSVPRSDDVFTFLSLIFSLGAVAILLPQPILLAAWIGLATPPLRLRLPAAAGVGMASFFAGIGSLRLCGTSLDFFHVLLLVSQLAALVTLLALILTGVRQQYHLRLVDALPFDTAPPQSDTQFRLRDLLLWTAGIAAVLALARALSTGEGKAVPLHGFELTLTYGGYLLICLSGLCIFGAALHVGRSHVWYAVNALFSGAILLLVGGVVLIISGSFLEALAVVVQSILPMLCVWFFYWLQFAPLTAAGWWIAEIDPHPQSTDYAAPPAPPPSPVASSPESE